MTNIVLLSLLILKTNVLNQFARDGSGCWDTSICWTADVKYSIPPSTSNTIVYFEYNNWLGKTTPLTNWYTNTTNIIICTTNNTIITCSTNSTKIPYVVTNGGWGLSFAPLNISPLSDYFGYFTNSPSTTRKTNTARFPIPPLQPMQYFRIRKL